MLLSSWKSHHQNITRTHRLCVLLIPTSGCLIISNCFSFLLHWGMLVQVKDLTVMCEITGIRARSVLRACSGFPSVSLFNVPFSVLLRFDRWMFRSLPVLAHAVCMAPERRGCRELHRAEQKRTTCFREWQVCAEWEVGCFCRWSIRQIAQQIDTTCVKCQTRWGMILVSGFEKVGSISLSCKDTCQWFSLACWRSQANGIHKHSFPSGWRLSGNDASSPAEAISGPWEWIAPVSTGEELVRDSDCALFTLPAHGSCHGTSHCLDRTASNVWSWAEKNSYGG